MNLLQNNNNEAEKTWKFKTTFVNKLDILQQTLYRKGRYVNKIHTCQINADHGVIGYREYNYKKFTWSDGLIHYILLHNSVPIIEFGDFIFSIHIKSRPIKLHYKGRLYLKDNFQYIKIFRNQLLILNALMEHGGHRKKYVNKKDNIFRNSEHLGSFDIINNKLERIIISTQTDQVEEEDAEIFFPRPVSYLSKYEYMFHTHPYTEGRREKGIIYDMPSIGDIFHFISLQNKGVIMGSLVIAPEGLYNLRNYSQPSQRITIKDYNNFSRQYNQHFKNINVTASSIFGADISDEFFNNTIAQKTSIYLDEINRFLHDYQLHIDFFHRVKDKLGNWIIDDIYLPIYNIT